MGLLDDFGIDTDTIPDAPSYTVEDGWYDFEVGNVYIKEGSAKNPDAVWLIIEYLLGDEGKKYSEFFTLPDDGANPTDKELEKLAWYKQRIVSLGFDASEINTVDRDDLVGITGTLHLMSTPGKGANRTTMYQNIRSLKVASPEEEEAPPVVKKAVAKAPARQTAAANPFKK